MICPMNGKQCSGKCAWALSYETWGADGKREAVSCAVALIAQDLAEQSDALAPYGVNFEEKGAHDDGKSD